MRSNILILFMVFAFFMTISLPTNAEAKGRKGSHRVGGTNSHGKGSHYVGGHK